MNKLLLCFLLVTGAYAAAAPTKYDDILFTNGVEVSDRVTSIADDSVSFVYKDETLQYRFAKTRSSEFNLPAVDGGNHFD